MELLGSFIPAAVFTSVSSADTAVLTVTDFLAGMNAELGFGALCMCCR